MTNNLGAQAYFDGRWDDAVEHYDRSRTASLRVGNAVVAAIGAMNLGEIFVNQGRLDEAERALTEAGRVFRASGHDAAPATDIQLGRMLMERGRYDEAEAHLHRCSRGGDVRRSKGLGARGRGPPRRLPAPQRPVRMTPWTRCRWRGARHTTRLRCGSPNSPPSKHAPLPRVGRFEEAREACRAGRDEAHHQGLVFSLALVLVAQAEVEVLAGRSSRDSVVTAPLAEAKDLLDRLGCAGRIPAHLVQATSPEPQ